MKFSISTKSPQKIHRVLDWNEVITVDRNYTVVRALEKGKLLGQACIAFEKGGAWIYWLTVNPKCRGEGIGTLLMDKVESVIEMENVSTIFLEPQKENEKFLVPWYESMGYEKTKRDPRNGEWIMIKEI